MKHSFKRALAIMLSVLLMTSNLGLTAFAEDFTSGTDDSVLIDDEELFTSDDLSEDLPLPEIYSEDIEPPVVEAEPLLLGDIDLGDTDGLTIEPEEFPEEVFEETPAAPFDQAVTLDGVIFAVTADAGMFPEDAVLRVQEAENAAITEAAEKAMYEGNWEEYGEDENWSQSDADMTVLMKLAFYCHGDMGQMDRLFRASGLMRDKWDRGLAGSTYGVVSMTNAINHCSAFYDPDHNRVPAAEDFAEIFGEDEKDEADDNEQNLDKLLDSFITTKPSADELYAADNLLLAAYEAFRNISAGLTAIPFERLNDNEDIINFRNGLLRLSTMELLPHSPEVLLAGQNHP